MSRLAARLIPLLALAGCPGMCDEAGPPGPCLDVVRCSDGAPIGTVQVQMFDEQASLVGQTTTDAQGMFCVPQGTGATDVALSKAGFRTLVLTVAGIAGPHCLAELVCTPGAPASCPCPDGGTGQAACLEGGAALGPCTGCP